MIQSQIIEHSAYNNQEIISIQTKAPKFLDAEIEKHRMISSNSSSDRAVPIHRMIDAEFFLPSDIRLDMKGMQGTKKLNDIDVKRFHSDLSMHREQACQLMENWEIIHKQHLNRLLLPYSYQTKIMTANKDQWDYFLSLRLHSAADPAIYQLAQCIKDSIDESRPALLDIGDWHLPYIEACEMYEHSIEDLIKMSCARCARTSYDNFDGNHPSKEEDFKLYYFLVNHLHLTPLEHQATPMAKNYDLTTDGISHIDQYGKFWSGNFHAFIQNRKVLEDQAHE